MTDGSASDPLAMAERQVRNMAEKYVERSGFAFNPDGKVVEMILKGLSERKLMKGFAYCPCRVLSGNPKEDAAKICPCAFHKEEIAKDGMCKCRIFVSKEYAERRSS